MEKKKLLLAPLDPVHNVGLRVIDKALKERGHETILLPPDCTVEEVIETAVKNKVDFILVSRTVGYKVAETLARLVDMAEATGLREKTKLVVGGMSITPELAAELGFDAGFGGGTKPEEAVAYVEGRKAAPKGEEAYVKTKKNVTEGYSYKFLNKRIAELLNKITDGILAWAQNKTSPGIMRARIREKILELEHAQSRGEISKEKASKQLAKLREDYAKHCDEIVADFYAKGNVPKLVRPLTQEEVALAEKYVLKEKRLRPSRIQHVVKNPLVFIQYGTGCPIMDVAHIKAAEAWGADGVSHFAPSWEARTEGLPEGYLAHSESGTLPTYENLGLIGRSLNDSTIWLVRTHRGLNIAETAVLAGELKADLTKTDIVYGSMGGGIDPARTAVDSVEVIRLSANYGTSLDTTMNQVLCGAPFYKVFAGALIVANLALRFGVKPIMGPLFCYAPEAMIGGQMEDNYINFNAALVYACRKVIDAPVRAGEPVGFFTQTEDRVQASTTTALHSSLAASLNSDILTISSTDEAYARGPISVGSRIDSLKAVKEAFRFFGSINIEPTFKAKEYADEFVRNAEKTLKEVADIGLVESICQGVFSTREEGGYPGRAGRNTVIER